MRRYTLLPLLLGLGRLLWAQDAAADAALSKVSRGFFIENKGQWHRDVLYLYRGPGMDAWVTRYGLNLTFIKIEKPLLPLSPDLPSHERDRLEREHALLLGHRVLVELEGANPQPTTEGLDKKPGYYNYFIGNDPSKHATNVGLYGEAQVKEVYPGISLRYYLEEGRLRYDYLVAPGADPSQIRFRLRGADKVEVRGQKLVFTTRFGSVELCELRAYQGASPVPAQFIEEGGRYRIAVGSYDRTQPLVIDPLVYSTYVGGSSMEVAFDMAVDQQGNAYITGFTASANYDTTAGAFQTLHAGAIDAFVTKLNAAGNQLVYSTFLGGSHGEEGTSIEVDGRGYAYVTGSTQSDNFDITTGAYQTNWGGGTCEGEPCADAFVTKLNPSGSTLVYSTYLGGGREDRGTGIAIDRWGNAYITGYTQSSNYPVTSNAYQGSISGGTCGQAPCSDVFVTKLNPDGNDLVYSTYIGGSNSDEAYDIVIDGSGVAYITGWTNSPNYDVTGATAYQPTYGGEGDAFITKLNQNGTGLIYSTYLGGSKMDEGVDIAIDMPGNIYITGRTRSSDYDITPGAFQTSIRGTGCGSSPCYDAFVTKLNTGQHGVQGLIYSTYLGGTRDEEAYGIAVDRDGYVYVTGFTESSDYYTTAGAVQAAASAGTGGSCGPVGTCSDLFLTKLNPVAGSQLLYSTYLGGTHRDVGLEVAVLGNFVYIAGATGSEDFDITSGAFQTAFAGAVDVFVTKLEISSTSTFLPSPSTTPFWVLYPNPNGGSFFIENSLGREAEFEVIDQKGQVVGIVRRKEGRQACQLDLPAGMYLVRERQSGSAQRLIVIE